MKKLDEAVLNKKPTVDDLDFVNNTEEELIIRLRNISDLAKQMKDILVKERNNGNDK